MVPTHRPANSANTKVPGPATLSGASTPKMPRDCGVNRPCLGHARNDIGGEEQVVELEAGAERDQDDQVPDVPAAGQAVEPGGEFRRGWGGHPGLSSGDWGGRYRSGGGCGDDEITSSHTEVGAALQSEAAALKGRGCVAAGGGSAQGVSGAPLPNVQAAMVPRAKILSYLLDATHPGNGGKAAFFNPFGFTAQNWGILQSALQRRSWHASGRQGGDGCVGHEVRGSLQLAKP